MKNIIITFLFSIFCFAAIAQSDCAIDPETQIRDFCDAAKECLDTTIVSNRNFISGDTIYSEVCITDNIGVMTCDTAWTYSYIETDTTGGEVTFIEYTDASDGGQDSLITGSNILPVPSINLEKTFGAFDDNDGDGTIEVGETATFDFEVCNDGVTELTTLTITDPDVTFSPAPPASLAVGQCVSFVGTYIITQDDIDAGFVENQAQADATDENGMTTMDISDDPADPTNNDGNGDGTPDDPAIATIPFECDCEDDNNILPLGQTVFTNLLANDNFSNCADGSLPIITFSNVINASVSYDPSNGLVSVTAIAPFPNSASFDYEVTCGDYTASCCAANYEVFEKKPAVDDEIYLSAGDTSPATDATANDGCTLTGVSTWDNIPPVAFGTITGTPDNFTYTAPAGFCGSTLAPYTNACGSSATVLIYVSCIVTNPDLLVVDAGDTTATQSLGGNDACINSTSTYELLDALGNIVNTFPAELSVCDANGCGTSNLVSLDSVAIVAFSGATGEVDIEYYGSTYPDDGSIGFCYNYRHHCLDANGVTIETEDDCAEIIFSEEPCLESFFEQRIFFDHAFLTPAIGVPNSSGSTTLVGNSTWSGGAVSGITTNGTYEWEYFNDNQLSSVGANILPTSVLRCNGQTNADVLRVQINYPNEWQGFTNSCSNVVEGELISNHFNLNAHSCPTKVTIQFCGGTVDAITTPAGAVATLISTSGTCSIYEVTNDCTGAGNNPNTAFTGTFTSVDALFNVNDLGAMSGFCSDNLSHSYFQKVQLICCE